MAAGVPCALVTSCSSTFTGDRLVQHILGAEDLLVEVTADDAVRFYPWTIDNKYYSADINLCVVPNKCLVTAEVAESVQALVVYFDSTQVSFGFPGTLRRKLFCAPPRPPRRLFHEVSYCLFFWVGWFVCFSSLQKSGLDSVSSWLPLAEAWLPEVMILVCDRVCENGVNRQKAQEWCIKHGFELVELSPEELPEEDDDFPESTGVKRIIQALNANVWSNVVMKNDRNQGFSLLSSLAGANHSIGSAEMRHSEQPRLPAAARTESLLDHRGGASNTTDAQADSIVDPMLDLDIQELASLTTGGGDLENFERLFSKLKEMKDKAATLPHEQRKLHAEKVAKAFWMAIGGDRDEIEGLSSDEEH
ncbi:alpha- and gamma-adaptin-binding protein p34 isoform X1 [Prionailurus bengalensis]|nr:alpha- and gamma-adaptin-binding protein p34 isoform X1 [Prionailurus bengalensis]